MGPIHSAPAESRVRPAWPRARLTPGLAPACPSPACSYQVPRLELLSCSTNGELMAAGGGDKILFWDRRTQVRCSSNNWWIGPLPCQGGHPLRERHCLGCSVRPPLRHSNYPTPCPAPPCPALQRPLASFDDTHCQDVTQVAFHPTHRSWLVSGSEDGLIAAFNTAPQLGEQSGRARHGCRRLVGPGPAGAALPCKACPPAGLFPMAAPAPRFSSLLPSLPLLQMRRRGSRLP